MKNLITLLSLAFCLLIGNTTYAVVAPINSGNTEVAAETAPLSKKELRKQAKLQKKLAKLEKRMADGPFDDDVKKWRNFWLLGWGVGILLIILAAALFVGTLGSGFGFAAILYLLGYLSILFGSISLIVWLVKMAS